MKTIIQVGPGSLVTGNNASLNPAAPSGVAVGDLMCILAAIRTGSPRTPLGWKTLAQTDGIALMAKFWTVNDTMPTITFVGGAAGDDTIARSFILRNVFSDIDQVAVGVTLQSNGSAQNVAVPAVTPTTDGCLVLRIGFKQDDYTSVSLAGYTFFSSGSSTVGNDAGFFILSKLQTAAATEAAGTVTVTGGAGATSVAISMAIRPYVTTWTDLGEGDRPCDLPADFNLVSNSAMTALQSIEDTVAFLSSPPAFRVSAGVATVNSNSVIPFSSVDIDPEGIVDLVFDAYAVSAAPRSGVWASIHNINATFYLEGNQVAMGYADDSTQNTSSRDLNTTNNPPGGGAVSSASAVIASSETTSVKRFSTTYSPLGFSIPASPTVSKATMQAVWVSD